VRGHHQIGHEIEPPQGTIPAGAGTPRVVKFLLNAHRDYPRGCGDTPRIETRLAYDRGLSPRVRGHPCPRARVPVRSGTIPAGAGTPGPPPDRKRP